METVLQTSFRFNLNWWFGDFVDFPNNISPICSKFQVRFSYLCIQVFHVHIHIDIICNDCLRNVFWPFYGYSVFVSLQWDCKEQSSAVVWITCAFLSSLPLMGLRSSLFSETGSICFLNFISTLTLYRINSFVYSLIGLFILLSTIIFNMCVVISLCKNIVTTNAVSQKSRKKGNTFNVVFLLVIVLTFATCWTPLMV